MSTVGCYLDCTHASSRCQAGNFGEPRTSGSASPTSRVSAPLTRAKLQLSRRSLSFEAAHEGAIRRLRSVAMNRKRYCGPIPHLWGKTARLRSSVSGAGQVMAQFEELYLEEARDWWQFPEADFVAIGETAAAGGQLR